MRTHRFGRKIKLPATIAIKHQLRMLMAQDEAKKAEELKQVADSAAKNCLQSDIQLTAWKEREHQ